MPASTILAPIKKVFKRDIDDGDRSEPNSPLHESLLAKDYGIVPCLSESDSDASIVPAHPQDGVPTLRKVTALEDYPLLPTNAATPHTSVNPLDVNVELASARIAENTEDGEDEEENTLSDTQLRRLYDDEEVERFLTVFATHVNEITLAPPVQNQKPRKVRIVRLNFKDGRPGDIRLIPIADEDDSDAETDIDEPWTYLNSDEALAASKSITTIPELAEPAKLKHKPPQYLSARVAAFLVSHLPPKPIAPSSKFKLGDARLAGQRMYFSAYPFYAPFIAKLIALAAWSNWHHSARVCAVFWVLWWFNMLLPALLGKILFTLLHCGIVQSPTLGELRKRRRVAQEADELGNTIAEHEAAASFFGTGSVPGVGYGGGDMGFRDLLKLTKLIIKGKGKKGTEKAKQATNTIVPSIGANVDDEEVNHANENDDWRLVALKAMEDLADFHERVRNLFTWRRGQSSRLYALVLIFLTLFVAVIPGQVLARLCCAVVGFLYWFAVPVILAMPSEAFVRLPLPLADVPSDMEYAMSLISARVLHGESIIPASHQVRRQHGRARRVIANTLNLATTEGPGDVTRDRSTWAAESGHMQSVDDMKKEANEKEAVVAEERAAAKGIAKTTTSEEVGAMEDAKPNIGPMDRLKHQWEAGKADLLGKYDEPEESLHGIGAPQTVPANHKATPGSLTLSSESISFTPLLVSTPRCIIPLEHIQGVKKTHHTNGLRIRHKDDDQVEHYVVFRFIPNRDEIFGKLVGWGGKQWRKV